MNKYLQIIDNTLKRMGFKTFIIHTQDGIPGGCPKVLIEAYVTNEEAEGLDDLDYRIRRLEESRDGAHAQANRWGHDRDLLESRVVVLERELAEAKIAETKAVTRKLNIERKLFQLLDGKEEE
jgi:hypothetical protein